jgi:DNA-binding MarR family transcriptional regulator
VTDEPSGRDQLAEQVADLLWQVRHLMRDRLSADIPGDEQAVWIGRFRILGRVVADPGVTVNELARRVLMPRSRVSVLVEELRREELLRKERDSDDRRLVRLRPTDLGRTTVMEWRAAYRALLGAYLRRLSPQVREGLIAGLQSLRDALATGGEP